MEALGVAGATLALLILYLGLGTWIFVALMMVSVSALVLLLDMPINRVGAIMMGTMWRTASTWELAAVPIFIVMGEIVFRTDISERLFRGLSPWVNPIPGRLLHCNVGGCTLFAAVSGSSTATTATIGKITGGALAQRGYDVRLSIGSLAGAGSLGLMIPPSISMIIYGVLAEESIAHLFAAGVFPGLLITALYTAYIIVRCMLDPSKSPEEDVNYTWSDRLRGLLDLTPVLLLMAIVLGGIYTGLVTPSEAAVLGFVAALVVTLLLRQLTWRIFIDSLLGATRITCMVITILVAASFMSSAMGYLHVPQEIAKGIAFLELGPLGLIILLGAFYVILGLFLDGLSIMVMTLPITLPLITAAGFDAVWFGVFLVIMIELGLVTPPIGFNLFVLQGLTGHKMGLIARAAFPFFLLMGVAGIIVTMFPEIALWLPRVLFGG
ncbi:MAG: TRAP transporter large permease [Gammaproteobacteria bacterium]